MSQIVQAVFLAAALAASLVLLFRGRRSSTFLWITGGLAGVAASVGFGAAMQPEPDHELRTSLPGASTQDLGWVRSDACQSCHPGQYATWHSSYHRSMTQVATPETVLAPFDGRRLQANGRTFLVGRDDHELYWLEELATDGGNAPPLEVRHRVVMTTGSHYQQMFWTACEDGALEAFPWVYEITEQRWVPSECTALRPQVPEARVTWNDNCIRCHSVGQQPGYNGGAAGHWDTRVAELGIACGSCHGPAEEHVAAHHNPVSRYQNRLADTPDPTIVNPRRLDHEQSTELCAQCHSLVLPLDRGGYLAGGQTYVAGGDLWEHFEMAQPEKRHRFEWPDGGLRVAGREYGAMAQSGCYTRGELSCLSCHSMHTEDPQDQVKEGMATDEACLQCHEEFRGRVAEHTFHDAASAGSRCYGCHMSYTSYALLGAARMHKIDSPAVTGVRTNERPNACNLCHLDRTLAWTAEHLEKWYGTTPPELNEEHRRVAAGVLWAVKGDAVQRVLTAWHMGQPFVQEAAGRDWMVPHLAELLVDSYPAIRLVAHRALRDLMGPEVVEFDYVRPPAEGVRAAADVLRWWIAQDSKVVPRPETLVVAPGKVRLDVLRKLRLERDDTPVFLAE